VKLQFKVHEKATNMLKDYQRNDVHFGRDQRREGYLPRKDTE